MEYVVCNLCQSDQSRTVFRENGFDIVRCESCGLVYVNPRLTEEELGLLYRNYDACGPEIPQDPLPSWLPAYLEKVGAYYSNLSEEDKSLYAQHRTEWLEAIAEHCSQGRLLDVGCGEGAFLKLAGEEYGYDVYGVEPAEDLAATCQATLGLENVFRGTFEEADYPNGFFDVITMTDVLEHFRDPVSVLRKADRLLKQGGVLFIKVPNVDYLLLKARLLAFFGLKDRMSAQLPMGIMAPEEHLYNFSSRTLCALLERAGFSVPKVSYVQEVQKGRGWKRRAFLGSYDFITKYLFHLSLAKLMFTRTLLAWAIKARG